MGGLLKQFRAATDFQAIAFARIWYPDPEGYVFDTTHSKGTVNVGGYSNPEVDRLLEEQRATIDPARRVALWRELQRLYAQDVPIVWTYAMHAWRPYLKNFLPMANASRVHLRQTWVER